MYVFGVKKKKSFQSINQSNVICKALNYSQRHLEVLNTIRRNLPEQALCDSGQEKLPCRKKPRAELDCLDQFG